MVLEHRHKRRGGGELDTHREVENSAHWALLPPEQTMMGLYYPALLPVSKLTATCKQLQCVSGRVKYLARKLALS